MASDGAVGRSENRKDGDSLTYADFTVGTASEDANPTTSVFGVTGPDTAFDRTLALSSGTMSLSTWSLLIEVARLQNPLDATRRLQRHRPPRLPRPHRRSPPRPAPRPPPRPLRRRQVWALDPDAPIADLQPFLTITGAKSHDRANSSRRTASAKFSATDTLRSDSAATVGVGALSRGRERTEAMRLRTARTSCSVNGAAAARLKASQKRPRIVG